MNEAIKLAIDKGGYSTSKMYLHGGEDSFISYDTFIKMNNAWISQDPEFWQALGKALGWPDKVCEKCGGNGELLSGTADGPRYCCGAYEVTAREETSWKWHWHRYIDVLADGGDQDTFWKDLIKK